MLTIRHKFTMKDQTSPVFRSPLYNRDLNTEHSITGHLASNYFGPLEYRACPVFGTPIYLITIISHTTVDIKPFHIKTSKMVLYLQATKFISHKT